MRAAIRSSRSAACWASASRQLELGGLALDLRGEGLLPRLHPSAPHADNLVVDRPGRLVDPKADHGHVVLDAGHLIGPHADPEGVPEDPDHLALQEGAAEVRLPAPVHRQLERVVDGDHGVPLLFVVLLEVEATPAAAADRGPPGEEALGEGVPELVDHRLVVGFGPERGGAGHQQPEQLGTTLLGQGAEEVGEGRIEPEIDAGDAKEGQRALLEVPLEATAAEVELEAGGGRRVELHRGPGRIGAPSGRS